MSGTPVKVKTLLMALLLLALIGLAILWHREDLASLSSISDLLSELRRSSQKISPIFALLYLILASVLAVPLGVIIVVSAIAFGPLTGAAYTLCGATLGAALSYGIGRYLGHEGLCKFGGERVNSISQRLADKGVFAVFIIRLLPIAPFAIVNMIAGMTHVRIRDFIAGTVLGMIPGTLLISFFIEQLQHLI